MHIVCLHALARSSRSMQPLARRLARRHTVEVLGYPSTRARLLDCAHHVLEALDRRGLLGLGDDLGVVGHSMGGLVWRALPAARPGFRCGRSVLLGSPLLGSIIAERLGRAVGFRQLYGPGLADLAPACVAALPPPPGPFGVVAGSRWHPLVPAAHVTRLLAPGEPSDSTVLVAETRHPAAADHVVVDAAHTFLPSHPAVQALVERFLETGRFGA